MTMIAAIADIIEDIRLGRMVILVDDEDRENEGDLIVAADCITADHVNFMARQGCGLICLALAPALCDRLELPPMVTQNSAKNQTAFTVSIEAKEGITTGISAADRAVTIKTAINPATRADDLARPGHIFPLRAAKGGVLERQGHTEASVDLARLAGFTPAGVICEVLNEDGTMARLPELLVFGQKYGLKVGTIEALKAYIQNYS